MIINLAPNQIKVCAFNRKGPHSFVGRDGKRFVNPGDQFYDEVKYLHDQGYKIVRIIFNENDYAQYLNWIPRAILRSQSLIHSGKRR